AWTSKAGSRSGSWTRDRRRASSTCRRSRRPSRTTGSFVARFPAGTWDRDTFEWWLRRPTDDSQLLYLKISFVDDQDRVMAFESDWDVICGGSPTITRRRDLGRPEE